MTAVRSPRARHPSSWSRNASKTWPHVRARKGWWQPGETSEAWKFVRETECAGGDLSFHAGEGGAGSPEIGLIGDPRQRGAESHALDAKVETGCGSGRRASPRL